jgi:hypothetical protein
MAKKNKTYKTYFAWIPGVNAGFAVFRDADGDNTYELSLGFIRILRTKTALGL